MSPMNTEGKIYNNTLSSQIKQHVKNVIITHKRSSSWECKAGNIRLKINEIYRLNRVKKKIRVIISIREEKACDDIHS